MPVVQNDYIRAEIVEHGAELIRLQDSRGTDLLWSGDQVECCLRLEGSTLQRVRALVN